MDRTPISPIWWDLRVVVNQPIQFLISSFSAVEEKLQKKGLLALLQGVQLFINRYRWYDHRNVRIYEYNGATAATLRLPQDRVTNQSIDARSEEIWQSMMDIYLDADKKLHKEKLEMLSKYKDL